MDRLTSLALQTLHAALVSQWMEILYIPVDILNNMAMWLSQQQNEEGAFVETADHYYDRSFLVSIVNHVFILIYLMWRSGIAVRRWTYDK